MIILHILLTILKIIGIVFLGILALVLLMTLLVMLIPVRYKVSASIKDKDIKASAMVSWFLHIVSVSYRYEEENHLSIRIFGFPIKLHKEEKVKKHKTKRQKENIEKNHVEEEIQEKVIQPESSDNKQDEPIIDSIELLSEIDEEDDCLLDTKEKKETDNSSLKKDESHKNNNKNSDTYDKINDKFNILKSDEFKEAFQLCKKSIGRLLRHVLPRKWNIKARLGFDDPATTGKIIAFTSMLYGFIRNHISITGDFEKQIIDIEGNFKGRITMIKLLIIGITVYFNKNIRKLIKQFKGA